MTTPNALEPFIPTWRNVRVFALGALWACLGGIIPALVDLTDDLLNYDPPLDWRHIAKLAAAGSAPMLVAYWRKYQALITPVPEDTGEKA